MDLLLCKACRDPLQQVTVHTNFVQIIKKV